MNCSGIRKKVLDYFASKGHCASGKHNNLENVILQRNSHRLPDLKAKQLHHHKGYA